METLNLKCEGVKLWGDKQTLRRLRKTIKFINDYGCVDLNTDFLLDIGPINHFGKKVASWFGLFYGKSLNSDIKGGSVFVDILYVLVFKIFSI